MQQLLLDLDHRLEPAARKGAVAEDRLGNGPLGLELGEAFHALDEPIEVVRRQIHAHRPASREIGDHSPGDRLELLRAREVEGKRAGERLQLSRQGELCRGEHDDPAVHLERRRQVSELAHDLGLVEVAVEILEEEECES